MFKYVLQIIVGILTFIVSAFIALYEGSAIIEKPFEWKHTTPFTNLFNTEITNGHDISPLDYFVYAAKFQPFFPIIMIVSILYILSITGLYLIKSKSKWGIGYWGIVGVILLIFSSSIFNSSTLRGSIFFWISSISGFISITIALLLYKLLHSTPKGELNS